MTDLEYDCMLSEAHAIPILDLAALIIDDFGKIGTKYTGRCPKHIDNKLGNLSFNIKGNYAKCFSCGTTFSTINLVKECCNVGFKDAISYLYTNFPSYFSRTPDFTNSGEYIAWNGLSGEEYRFLKFNTKYFIEGQPTSIRVFATQFPDEHDKILIRRIKEIYNDIHMLYRNMYDTGVSIEKLDNDREHIESKLVSLLEKGLINKSLLDKTKPSLYEMLKAM